MKIPENFVDKYFLEQYIVTNWDSILGMMSFSSDMYVGSIEEQIYEELKKYNLKYITLEEKENDEK